MYRELYCRKADKYYNVDVWKTDECPCGCGGEIMIDEQPIRGEDGEIEDMIVLAYIVHYD